MTNLEKKIIKKMAYAKIMGKNTLSQMSYLKEWVQTHSAKISYLKKECLSLVILPKVQSSLILAKHHPSIILIKNKNQLIQLKYLLDHYLHKSTILQSIKILLKLLSMPPGSTLTFYNTPTPEWLQCKLLFCCQI